LTLLGLLWWCALVATGYWLLGCRLLGARQSSYKQSSCRANDPSRAARDKPLVLAALRALLLAGRLALFWADLDLALPPSSGCSGVQSSPPAPPVAGTAYSNRRAMKMWSGSARRHSAAHT
jgi:hypothetical protein